MKLLAEDLLAEEIANDTETSDGLGKGGLGEKDKDLLKSLEKMAEEIEEEPDKPK